MSKLFKFVTWLVAMLVGIIVYNLIIGVFGLKRAVVTLIISILFAIYTSFQTQPEDKEPHA
jgi:uncharacterized membrane protein YuzA (DUF378 family)